MQGCSLHKEENITTNDLFKELDVDNNAELSLEGLLSIIGAEDFKSHHIQFVETVLANEQQIMEYKRKKSQADRHSKISLQFMLLILQVLPREHLPLLLMKQ